MRRGHRVRYSSVGYYEIGEDDTNYGTYAGNIIHFTQQLVTGAAAATSGKENQIVYTSTDLTGLEGELIKIGDEQYAVLAASTPEFLVLNTYYKGPSVDKGTSTPIYTNDGNGADASTDFSMDFSGTTLTFTEAYTEPTHDTDGNDIFLDRDLDADGEVDNFGAGDIIRVTYGLSGYSFDCLFTIDASTSTIADSSANSAVIAMTVSEDPTVNCPTWAAAQTAGSGSITVQVFAFTASAYTNGMYADDTRIFSSDITFTESQATQVTGAKQGADNVLTFATGTTTPADRSTQWRAGTIVLYENEFNVVDTCTTTTCTFKNALTTQDHGYDVDAVGHDIEYMYPVDYSAATPDYTYVSQCSNRGLCDGSSGLCQCFKGYTGDNCDTISELYA